MEPLVIIGIVVAIVIAVAALVSAHGKRTRREALEQRRQALLEKYRDPEVVDRILRQMFWTGQTQEQLVDSLGVAADVDHKVLKSKVREIWKYNQTGRNRFGLRITVENGIVVGWDQKD
jgi:hypothetical protein